MTITAGFDVGGAHLKVALAEGGALVDVKQVACPLWRGLEHLERALTETKPIYARASRHGVTMTGELSDIFPTRPEGVRTLVTRMVDAVGLGTRFWMGLRGFGSATDAIQHPAETGSTNFLAAAALAATRARDALLVDFGSTTADIVPIYAGAPRPQGVTDAERLATGELVYTGLTRTAVMGVATRAPFGGRMQGLAREYLATMADVRRVLGTLPEGLDLHATADGRGTSLEESLARLARMFGRDAGDGALEDWHRAARWLKGQQLASIVKEGCLPVLAASPLALEAPVIAAGIGAYEVPDIAAAIERPCLTFGTLVAGAGPCQDAATHAAPAAAIALLLNAVE